MTVQVIDSLHRLTQAHRGIQDLISMLHMVLCLLLDTPCMKKKQKQKHINYHLLRQIARKKKRMKNCSLCIRMEATC